MHDLECIDVALCQKLIFNYLKKLKRFNQSKPKWCGYKYETLFPHQFKLHDVLCRNYLQFCKLECSALT
jgi:hypothetical protein